MGKVYINLHPDYNYSNVVIAEHIDLKTYVKNVDWADWSWQKRNMIQITSFDGNGTHIKRTNVFAQRLLNAGHEVLIRNERKDEWNVFEDKGYTEDYMFEVDIEPMSSELNRELKSIKDDIKDEEELVESFKSKNEKTPEFLIECIVRCKKRYEQLESRERKRIEALKELFSYK